MTLRKFILTYSSPNNIRCAVLFKIIGLAIRLLPDNWKSPTAISNLIKTGHINIGDAARQNKEL